MSLSVLVVEDEAVVAIDLEFALEELGHSVVGAGRLSEAMSAVQSSDFDLAILDVNLNGEPSYPVASVLEAKGVPFVFVTGYGVDGLEENWRHTRVLQKPIQRDALTSLLKTISPRQGAAGGVN